MTTAFERLKARPRTDVSRGDFSLTERANVRKLDVTGSAGRSSKGDYIGSFSPVYYIEGDTERAARVFAEVNADELSRVDFSKRNVVSSSVSQEQYDLILHHAGERVREVYPTVVREDRRSGVTWMLDRGHYEENPEKRYTTGTRMVAKVPPEVSLRDVFEESSTPITSSDVSEAGILGGVGQVLDYFRVASDFACSPVSIDGEIAVTKA
ncbi:hypothetical protein [Halobacterium wangiae]|uniref:hypothetical protein n=1 Tax=Halobacterium wangiae TaxID=2902623 RepID=UPI001E2FF919|nr:hypothetical protein [Halobacterium wangiae]